MPIANPEANPEADPEPTPALAGIHDRMPVMLDRESRAIWLEREATPERLHELLRPFDSEALAIHPVSSDVGSPKNDWPDLVLPVVPPSERQGRVLP